MRPLALCVVAGCGRVNFDSRTDSLVDAAPQQLEVLVVPGLGTPVPSTIELAAGVTYQLRVTGTFVIGGGTDPICDAEYWDFAAGAKDKCDDLVTDAGLAIDDPVIDDDKQPHWGPYRADHSYAVDFIGKGAPIVATIHDVAPSNNTGDLVLEIWGTQ